MPLNVRMTEHFITINNERLPILIRKHRKSRRMVLRYQPLRKAIGLTLPRYVSIRQGLHFIEEKREWLEREMQEHSHSVPLADGQIIPVLGTHYALKHIGGRGVVRIEGEAILVPGDEAFMARRVREWVKAQAREYVIGLAQEKSALVGRKVRGVALRDTSSRWGSCSHDGALSFSWRLVFAPREILEYVVCHEVAHLREHNHSDAYWNIVAQLFPNYPQAERWLKDYGHQLYGYG